MTKNYNEMALKYHLSNQGKLESNLKSEINNKQDLAVIYTPGVGAVSALIATDNSLARKYTLSGRTIAVISDGSAVLGLGNIGPSAALPVMEGKCALIKKFSGLDSWPIVLDTQDKDELIKIIKALAPNFAGINLEDISAPRCFEIEEALQDLGIPVFHDDQHGTAIVVLAGLINALKVVNKTEQKIKIVIVGAGAAGTAILKLLNGYFKTLAEILVLDSKGIISSDRNDLNSAKHDLLQFSNSNNQSGDLLVAVKDADVLIGVSAPDIFTEEHIRIMKQDSIVFALSNPVPEIMPDIAKTAGARVIATGRSDFPNQINNVLVFPGIFKGAVENNISKITFEMKIKAALAISSIILNPDEDNIIPDPFDPEVHRSVAGSIK